MAAKANENAIRSVTDGAKRSAIMDAIAAYDVPGSSAWGALDELSSHTEFEEADAVPEGIFEKSSDDFEAVATVYITLNYGDKNDQSSMSDSYPAHVHGRYDPQAETASIVDFTVDTSSFYR